MDAMLWFILLAALIALVFAFVTAKKVSAADAGTDRMKEIATAIHEGAEAFLLSEYKVLVVFVAVVFMLLRGRRPLFLARRLLRHADGDPRKCPYRQCCQNKGYG